MSFSACFNCEKSENHCHSQKPFVTLLQPLLLTKIENHTKSGFLHFEKYDYRFQWNKPTSKVDIYLPLSTNKYGCLQNRNFG